jgi:hypothetical protein
MIYSTDIIDQLFNGEPIDTPILHEIRIQDHIRQCIIAVYRRSIDFEKIWIGMDIYRRNGLVLCIANGERMVFCQDLLGSALLSQCPIGIDGMAFMAYTLTAVCHGYNRSLLLIDQTEQHKVFTNGAICLLASARPA